MSTMAPVRLERLVMYLVIPLARYTAHLLLLAECKHQQKMANWRWLRK